MKTFIVESSVVLALLITVFRGIFLVLSSKVEATKRESTFYIHAGVCALPFAFASWTVLPHLTTALNFFAKGDSWGKLIQFGGGYLLLIIISGLASLVLSYTIFKIVTKEKSVWEQIAGNSPSVSYLLSGIILTSGIMLSVLAGEIAKAMIPFTSVPFNY